MYQFTGKYITPNPGGIPVPPPRVNIDKCIKVGPTLWKYGKMIQIQYFGARFRTKQDKVCRISNPKS